MIRYLAILLLLLTDAAFAAGITYDFAYSGRLSDGTGKPYDGPVALSVSFFRDGSGGSALLTLTEGLGAVALQDGIFQVKLTLNASDYSLVFADVAQPVYVQITDLTHAAAVPYPRQQISMIPYAAKVPVDQKTIGFNAQGQLSVLPSSTAAPGQFLTEDTSGDFAWATPAAANAGVGPNSLVQLDSSAKLPAVDGSQVTNVAAGTVGGIAASAVASGVNAANAAASASTASTLVKRDASGNFAAGTITANLTGNISGSAGSVASTGVSGLTAGSIPFSNGTGLIQNNAKLFWDNATGRLGIGTTTPNEAVEVNGNVRIMPNANVYAESGILNLGNTDLGTGVRLVSASDTDIVVQPGASRALVVTGNVGIGTTSPAGILDVEGGTLAVVGNATPIRIVAQSAGASGVPSVGGSILLLPGKGGSGGANGNVGIGSTTPQTALDVSGQVRVAKNTVEPFTCDLAHDGTLALTHVYTMCVCNGVSGPADNWVKTTDGTTACVW